jgi:GrpB-like predicted nucleotidyltransferase (UPF0157 family)
MRRAFGVGAAPNPPINRTAFGRRLSDTLGAMEVRVVSPDPTWVESFSSEADLLRSALNDLEVEVHHIGSTSIQGIYAKPIIDILLVVRKLEDMDSRAKVMEALGYEAKGEFGIPARRYFRKDSSEGIRTYQVHAFERNSAGARRHLAFRDYMNAHDRAAEAYSSLKQRLARDFPFDVQAYMDGKDAFIKQHEALAIAWRSSK